MGEAGKRGGSRVQPSCWSAQVRAIHKIGAPVDDGLHKDLDGVAVREKVHNLKGMLHYPDLHRDTVVRHNSVGKSKGAKHTRRLFLPRAVEQDLPGQAVPGQASGYDLPPGASCRCYDHAASRSRSTCTATVLQCFATRMLGLFHSEPKVCRPNPQASLTETHLSTIGHCALRNRFF